jgi:hypothetical protein
MLVSRSLCLRNEEGINMGAATAELANGDGDDYFEEAAIEVELAANQLETAKGIDDIERYLGRQTLVDVGGFSQPAAGRFEQMGGIRNRLNHARAYTGYLTIQKPDIAIYRG